MGVRYILALLVAVVLVFAVGVPVTFLVARLSNRTKRMRQHLD